MTMAAKASSLLVGAQCHDDFLMVELYADNFGN